VALSTHEVEALARLEEALRAEDPALAATLSRTPPAADRDPREAAWGEPDRPGTSSARRAVPFLLAIALLALVLVPPTWQAGGAAVLVLLLAALAPRFVVRVVERFERRRTGRPR
jgi:Flp pilus assembly protein TadB